GSWSSSTSRPSRSRATSPGRSPRSRARRWTRCATITRGLAQIQKGANQAAVPFLERATKSDPGFALAWAKLAEAHANAGQGDEAEEAIERAQALADAGALPLAARYQIHATYALVKDDNENAALSYAELAKLYPDDPDIRMSLARAFEELG